MIQMAIRWLQQIPESAVALLGRFALATVFWTSGQTKIEGFALNVINGTYEWGWPRVNDTAYFLFAEEYALPLIPSVLAAQLATLAEHLLPACLCWD